MKKTKLFNVLIVLLLLFFVNCENEFDYGKLINVVKTTEFNNVTQTTANVSGNVITDNGKSLTARGICYSTTQNPTINDLKIVFNTATLGSYTCNITNLAPNAIYFARAYATNGYGTAYGNTITFKTLPATIPIISSTTAATSITQISAITGGNITNSGSANVTSRGVCYSSTQTIPTIAGLKTSNGTGIGTFSSTLTGLSPNTNYYIRAYASNSIGTAYGDVKTFTTNAATIPTGITTIAVSTITQTSASSGGSITNDGGASITSRGVCWSNTTSSPTIANTKTIDGTGIGIFSSSLTSLTTGTTYYVRAYATNSAGTAYGTTSTFTTLPSLAVGQSYQGGIIAYIFVSGDSGYITGQTHGLIATTSNQSTGAQWGCSGTSISGTSTTLGSGQTNTTAIVNGCSSTTNAAAICNNLSSGGYTDWYLPSSEELIKLYLNKSLIGGFNNSFYWSSTQNNSISAYSINFNTGTITTSSSKSSQIYVRAIRKF
ncbi:hypothetical protein B0A58_11790 [Flavobacterium branchiophilum NBRC 15030 = ATCC 35035]|uniref:Uncharacterized protein DUF1566 n=1 Tax=Flavobacterium branchiophilum TaxID=55197 RepID=A0A543G3C8_9FLAO|nr:DUF1566 domain-containing protein [Flavobacterium branchiophilum]OXA73345.1 hypothetical protein B0A58_11790 [Flavobacterium branchiophilum NBRC 15030 = ATCC 35035]TQM40590.1 uncharacterized protein DUF1566 [Flavobacterium branchiophilum]GEM56644.1 hypothetical protein FB1_28650 [Flavobacterium branchiophilum NBRC 15030 = ATCC 35035]